MKIIFFTLFLSSYAIGGETIVYFHGLNSNIKSSKVVLLKEGRAEKVEILLRSNRNSYITKCYSSIFEKTIVHAIDKIKVQIKKNQKN